MSLNRTGIEWTHVFGEGSGYTWNPITGCTEGCPYCYARELAETRLKKQFPEGFAHIYYHEERLRDVTPRQKPRGIFVGSMGDMWDSAVPQEWRDAVWQAMANAPQHVYLTLTKQPQNLSLRDTYCDLKHLWQGVTVTSEDDKNRLFRLLHGFGVERARPLFVSMEPLLGPIEHFTYHVMGEGRFVPDWIIIGADSNADADREVPKREWVERIVQQADRHDIPVFAKNNLRRVMGAEWVAAHQQWPEALQRIREEDSA